MENSMDDDECNGEELRFRLLQALDWVKRTGWLSRGKDTELAARVFDTWLLATETQACAQQGRDRMALLETLYAVFRDRHGVEATQHLCVIFNVALEAHARLREDRGGGVP